MLGCGSNCTVQLMGKPCTDASAMSRSNGDSLCEPQAQVTRQCVCCSVHCRRRDRCLSMEQRNPLAHLRHLCQGPTKLLALAQMVDGLTHDRIERTRDLCCAYQSGEGIGQLGLVDAKRTPTD